MAAGSDQGLLADGVEVDQVGDEVILRRSVGTREVQLLNIYNLSFVAVELYRKRTTICTHPELEVLNLSVIELGGVKAFTTIKK